jgi:hypothetical protein
MNNKIKSSLWLALIAINVNSFAEEASPPDNQSIKICTLWANKNVSSGYNFPTQTAYDNVKFSLRGSEYAQKRNIDSDDGTKTVEYMARDANLEGDDFKLAAPSGANAWACKDYSYSGKTHPSFSQKPITLEAIIHDEIKSKNEPCGEYCPASVEDAGHNKDAKISFSFNYNNSDYNNGCRILIEWVPKNQNDLGHFNWTKVKEDNKTPC